MAEKRHLMPTGKVIGLAALAGALAGAVAVYASNRLGGNNGRPEVAIAAADGVCAGKAAGADAIGAAATGEVAAMLPADPPQSLRSLAFNDPDGQPMTLADHAGKTLLVNLWATWCAPCRAEMPALNALQEAKGSDRFEVVAVNVDTGSDEKPRRFMAETKVDALGFYRDSSLELFNDLKKRGLALGLPVTLLVDRDGCLLASMNGPADWSSEDGKRLVDTASGS